MKILNSRKNRSRLGQQLVAVFFTLGIAGSPFGQTAAAACGDGRYESSPCIPTPSPAAPTAPAAAAAAAAPAVAATGATTAATPPSPPGGGGADDPGCTKAFDALSKQCVATAATYDANAQIGVSSLNQTPGNIHGAAGTEENAARIGQGANAGTAAACAETLKKCEETCGKAVTEHKNRGNAYRTANQATLAMQQDTYANTAQGHIESCKKNMGTLVTETGISATTLGLAAAAAGGIFLLTKSSGSKDKSSGDDTTTTSDDAGTDPISTDPDSGFQTYDDMVEYWTTNHCVAVLSNKISASEDIKSNCSIISKDPSFSSSLASLGTCSDVDNYGRPDCFDRLNNYCLQVTETSRSSDPTCAGFCVAKPEADSCKYVVGYTTPIGVPTIQPIDQNAITDQTSSSGSPFATGTSNTYRPLTQGVSSGGTPSYVSSSTRGTPRYVSSSQSQTGSSLSPRIGVPTSGTRTLASAGQPDCSSSQMMNKPECLAPMTKYCSQYGSQGKGCAEFCKTHKGVCKK